MVPLLSVSFDVLSATWILGQKMRHTKMVISNFTVSKSNAKATMSDHSLSFTDEEPTSPIAVDEGFFCIGNMLSLVVRMI